MNLAQKQNLVKNFILLLFITTIFSCSKTEQIQQTIDYANSKHVDAWLHHPVIGDPSFDTFERYAKNPIHRGKAPLEWPVNGFFFNDPVSGNWFIFVGHYSSGYAMGPDNKMICTVYRSTDHGETWEHLGPVFPETPFYFTGDSSPVKYAPDVSVVYDNGRYHMAYDWVNADAEWKNLKSGKSGVGYAWSDRPQGPYHRVEAPLIRNGHPFKEPIFKKYDRYYASTLVRRQNDWLLLTIMDSGHHFAWGLIGLTADNPEGPYSEPVPLFHVEGNTYQPPLMEYFPSFVHEGWIYAPSTSVALNRNFQMIQRVPVEQAMQPDAWKIYQHGSVWHAIDVPHEYFGIWGQAFSGFVDDKNQFHVMYPSRNADNLGTINIASRPWQKPYRKQGFCLSGHQGPSLTLLKNYYKDFQLDTKFTLSGTGTIIWAYAAPLGPDKPKSDASIHPLSLTQYTGLTIEKDTWKLASIDTKGKPNEISSGKLDNKTERHLFIDHMSNDSLVVKLDNNILWAGVMEQCNGAIGLLAEKNSYLAVESFSITGSSSPATLPLLYTEALLGAGQSLKDWEEKTAEEFRYQTGVVFKSQGGRVKWNIYGKGFTIWSPKGPDFGTVNILVDGDIKGTMDLSATSFIPSKPVFTLNSMETGYHAVVFEAQSGRLVIDSIDVLN